MTRQGRLEKLTENKHSEGNINFTLDHKERGKLQEVKLVNRLRMIRGIG